MAVLVASQVGGHVGAGLGLAYGWIWRRASANLGKEPFTTRFRRHVMFRHSSSAWLMGALVAALPGLLASFGEGISVAPLSVVGCVLAGATVAAIVWLVVACWGSADPFKPVSRAIGSVVVAIILAAWTLATAFREAPVRVEDGRAVFLGGSSSGTFLLVTFAAVLTLLIAGFFGRIQDVTGSDRSPAAHSPLRTVAGASLMALTLDVTILLAPGAFYAVPTAFVPVAVGWAAVSLLGASPMSRRKRAKWWAAITVLAIGWATMLASLGDLSNEMLTLAQTSWQAAGLLGSAVGLGILAPLCAGAYLVYERRKPTWGAGNDVPDSGRSAEY